jgi:diguanylate cyclase (GGDEF)-like protein
MGTQGLRVPIEARIAALVVMPDRLPSHAWLAFLAGGLGLAIGAGVVADVRPLQPAQIGMTIATTAAILIGVRAHHPSRRSPWWLLALSLVLTTSGAALSGPGATGIAGQGIGIAGEIAGFLGFLLLIRGRIPGGDRAALFDAAILVSGSGVLIWAFGFTPLIVASGENASLTAFVFFPALVAFAMVARLWFLDGAHRPSTRMTVLFVLGANAVTGLEAIRGGMGPGAFAATSQFAVFATFALMGAAALHPSMAIAPERHLQDLKPVTRRRIAALGAALLVNPATLAIQAWGGRPVDLAPHLIGGVVMGLLVIARLGDALHELADSLHERGSLVKLLERQALYDPLTALPNRVLFAQRLDSAFTSRSAGGTLAVLLLDLDDFKAVNDSYGHETGDALLVVVAERLRSSVREGDTVARLGGDEFVIALPDCRDPLVPVRLAERVLARLAEPIDIAGHHLTVRASIGVALTGTQGSTPDDLVRNADVAMYVAKGHANGSFEVFRSSMQAAASTRLQLRADLAAGIDAGELRLHYQPVVDLHTGRTVGYEALVRWLHDGTLVAPGEFIPIAESSGLIGPLTDWVIAEACRTTAGWGSGAHRPWVSINLPPNQLIREDIVAVLARNLEATGMAPQRLVVEITESSLLRIETARPALQRLSELGIRVAIDDFGTGYSALSYLGSLPIDIVKVDRSFVVALERPGPGKAIAEAIIALVTRLGMTTIGEGIETEDQLDRLAALGCHLGQGYYLARPVAANELRPFEEPIPLRAIDRHRRPRLRAADLLGTGTRAVRSVGAAEVWAASASARPATVH